MTTALAWVKPLHFQNFYIKNTLCNCMIRFAQYVLHYIVLHCTADCSRFYSKLQSQVQHQNQSNLCFQSSVLYFRKCWLLAFFRILVWRPWVWVQQFPGGIPSRSIWFIEILTQEGCNPKYLQLQRQELPIFCPINLRFTISFCPINSMQRL